MRAFIVFFLFSSAALAQQAMPGSPLSAPVTPGVTAASLASTFVKLDGSNGPLTGTLGTQQLTPSTNNAYDLGTTAKAYRIGFVYQTQIPSSADAVGVDGVGKLTYSSAHGHFRAVGQSSGGTSTPANVLTENDLTNTGAALGGTRLAMYANTADKGFTAGAGITGDAAAGTLVLASNGTNTCGTNGFLNVCGDGSIPDAVIKQSVNATLRTSLDVSNNGGYQGHIWVGGTSQPGNFFTSGVPYASNVFMFSGDNGSHLWLGTLGTSASVYIGTHSTNAVIIDGNQHTAILAPYTNTIRNLLGNGAIAFGDTATSPENDDALDLGDSGHRWRAAYLSSVVKASGAFTSSMATATSVTSGTCSSETCTTGDSVCNAQRGQVTATCTAGQTIIVTYAATQPTKPACTCTAGNAAASAVTLGELYCDSSTTALTITGPTAMTAGAVNYTCFE